MLSVHQIAPPAHIDIFATTDQSSLRRDEPIGGFGAGAGGIRDV